MNKEILKKLEKQIGIRAKGRITGLSVIKEIIKRPGLLCAFAQTLLQLDVPITSRTKDVLITFTDNCPQTPTTRDYVQLQTMLPQLTKYFDRESIGTIFTYAILYYLPNKTTMLDSNST